MKNASPNELLCLPGLMCVCVCDWMWSMDQPQLTGCYSLLEPGFLELEARREGERIVREGLCTLAVACVKKNGLGLGCIWHRSHRHGMVVIYRPACWQMIRYIHTCVQVEARVAYRFSNCIWEQIRVASCMITFPCMLISNWLA